MSHTTKYNFATSVIVISTTHCYDAQEHYICKEIRDPKDLPQHVPHLGNLDQFLYLPLHGLEGHLAVEVDDLPLDDHVEVVLGVQQLTVLYQQPLQAIDAAKLFWKFAAKLQ